MKARTYGPLVLAIALASASAPAHASQWLKLTAPAPNATLGPLAQTVTFTYVIDKTGFHNHVNEPMSSIGTFITVCTGGCSGNETIDYRELGPNEQTTTSLDISRIKQYLTQHNLPIGTQIKWNLRFHVPGNIIVPNEVQTNSTFYLGHLEAAGGVHLEVKTPTPTPRVVH